MFLYYLNEFMAKYNLICISNDETRFSWIQLNKKWTCKSKK